MSFGPRDIDNNQVNPIATVNRNAIGKHHIILNTLWIANVFPKLPHDSTCIANSLNFENTRGWFCYPQNDFPSFRICKCRIRLPYIIGKADRSFLKFNRLALCQRFLWTEKHI